LLPHLRVQLLQLLEQGAQLIRWQDVVQLEEAFYGLLEKKLFYTDENSEMIKGETVFK